MNLVVLDRDFEILEYVDKFNSLIWTERYCDSGDFELNLNASENDDLSYFALDNYLQISDSPECLMIIEDVEIHKSHEDGIEVKVSGRSLESILGRRVIVKGAEVRDSQLTNVIWSIFMQNITSAEIVARRIPYFSYDLPSNIGNRLIGVDYETFDTVEDTIKHICEVMGIAYKVIFDEDNKRFVTKFYTANSVGFVDDKGFTDGAIFSESYDNIISMDSVQSTKNMKNAVLGHMATTFTISYETDSGTKTVTKEFNKVLSYGEGTGLLRREYGFECPDKEDETWSTKAPNAEQVDSAHSWLISEATRHMTNKTQDEFNKNKDIKLTSVYDAEVVVDNPYFQLNKDYFLGDVIIIKDIMGTVRKRVTEVIRSYADNEKRIYCSFENVD